MRLHTWLLATAALAFVLAPQARADDPSDDLKALAGTWTATKIVNDGQEGDAEHLKDVQLVFKEDGSYILRNAQGNSKGKITVDSTKKPAEMDATYESDQGDRGKALCIYKLEGDTLTVCWSDQGERPDEFTAESGSGRRLMVMKREKE